LLKSKHVYIIKGENMIKTSPHNKTSNCPWITSDKENSVGDSLPRKFAIAGKGGSGKTTISGTLARLMASKTEQNLIAIDGDSNPNLATTLGLSREEISKIVPIPRSIVNRMTDKDGKKRAVLLKRPDEIINEFGIDTPDGIKLLLMATIDHAGAG
jgi:CO dehydrogenase maturation factor